SVLSADHDDQGQSEGKTGCKCGTGTGSNHADDDRFSRCSNPANDSSDALVSLMMNIDLAQLEALAAAVSEGTFDAAARKLQVTPSAISQRVKALETSVGRVLLTRAKPVLPT